MCLGNTLRNSQIWFMGLSCEGPGFDDLHDPSNSAYYVIPFACELLYVLDRDILGIFRHTMLKIVLTFPFPWVCETCPLHRTFLLHTSFLFYICLCAQVQAQIMLLTIDLVTIRTKETTQSFLFLWSGEKQLSASANAYTYLLTSFFVDVMMSLLIRENDLK